MAKEYKNIGVDPAVWEELKKVCERDGLKIGRVTEMAVKQWLKEHKK
jgi:hypothetical protein